jgi:threonine dehydrogenase-like Zn-dependent dehydrogenase
MLVSQVIGPRRSEIVEMPDPLPGPKEVVVDVLACGVCTSDRTVWRERGTRAAPLRLGHEIVGRVSAVGSEASAWRPGDIVTGLGGNGYATKAAMDANAILPVPSGFPVEHLIGEPVADLEEAIGRSGIVPGMRVAVVGLGFMGLGLVQLAKYRLTGLLVGVDPRPEARARALALGAHEVYHPDELPPEFRDQAKSGREERMDVVLEATGVTPGLDTMSAMVRPYGTVCVIGYHHAGTALMDMNLWYKGVTVVNGFSPQRPRTMRAMERVLGLIASQQFAYAPLITNRFGLDGVDAAHELMEAPGPDFVKSAIVMA